MIARFVLICAAGLTLLLGYQLSRAQSPVPVLESAQDAQAALRDAETQGREAQLRAEAFERQAIGAIAAADRTARESAAIAARVQQAEALIAENEAKVRLIAQQQIALRFQLAQRQKPVVELTAALQRLSRRPAVFALLRPGALQDAVYLRAVLETMLPEIGHRTADLRRAIERSKQLQRAAEQASANLRNSQVELGQRRQLLATLEARQRLGSRSASSSADREAERALALAEQARDLTSLIGELDKAGRLRSQLAALPGPVLRPAQPQGNAVAPMAESPAPVVNAPAPYQLPVAGRLLSGFGNGAAGRTESRGLSIAARAGAQVIAPGAGRVAFAGPYQGYGTIVIIEHGGGWTSLVTGLATLNVRVGQSVIAGAPLGQVGPGRPTLMLELRKDGTPLNPLDFLRR